MIVRSVCSSGYGCGCELLYWCAHIQTASKQFIPLFSGLKRNKIRYLENISDRANSITRIISYSHMLTSMVLFLFTFGAHVFRWLAFSYIQFTFKIMCADCCVVQIDKKNAWDRWIIPDWLNEYLNAMWKNVMHLHFLKRESSLNSQFYFNSRILSFEFLFAEKVRRHNPKQK